LNILCSVSYDGFEFSGWQKQPNKITIQETIENALSQIYNQNINIVGAGRTDSGVHSFRNYFNFKINDNKIPLEKIPIVINNQLPKSIRIIDAKLVSDDFSARYNATRRIYEYYIEQTPPTPFLRNYRMFYEKYLDVQKMNEAAKYLIGEYDFSAFKASDCDSKTQIRQVFDAYVKKSENTIIFHIEANAFLKNMVRIIVGTLLNIGAGKQSIDYIDFLIKSRERVRAGKTVEPNGLFLIDVIF